MTQAQVYATFARCLFERGDASIVLCHASHSMKVEGLPSWCPNFAQNPPAGWLGAYHMLFGLAAGHETVPSGKEQIKVQQSWTVIELIGFEVDVILEIVSLNYG